MSSAQFPRLSPSLARGPSGKPNEMRHMATFHVSNLWVAACVPGLIVTVCQPPPTAKPICFFVCLASDECARVCIPRYYHYVLFRGKWEVAEGCAVAEKKHTQKRARERTLKQNEIRTSLLTHDTVGAVRYCKMLLVVPRLAGVWFFENKPISIAVRIG